jgi:hypothetical protein
MSSKVAQSGVSAMVTGSVRKLAGAADPMHEDGCSTILGVPVLWLLYSFLPLDCCLW